MNFRFAEDTQLYTGDGKRLVETLKEHFLALAFNHNRLAGRRTEETDFRNRQTQYRTGMKRKLAQILTDHRHHSRVMRTRAHFREDHLIAADKHLHAEDTESAERVCYHLRYPLRVLERLLTHRLRLPRLAVIAVHLMVTDRVQERRSADVTHGQKSDLIIKMNESLYDHATGSGATAFLRSCPRSLNLALVMDGRLTMARGGHNRLYHTRDADLFHRSDELVVIVGELVRSRR